MVSAFYLSDIGSAGLPYRVIVSVFFHTNLGSACFYGEIISSFFLTEIGSVCFQIEKGLACFHIEMVSVYSTSTCESKKVRISMYGQKYRKATLVHLCVWEEVSKGYIGAYGGCIQLMVMV